MIVSSLDIGSNTILLLTAKVLKNKRLIPLVEATETPRLAEGLKASGVISQTRLELAVQSILRLQTLAQSYGSQRTYAVATAAIREARNRESVVEEIFRRTGVRPEVVSGRTEAELTYRGGVIGFSVLKARRIVLDIGGASSEFVWGEQERIQAARSLKIGAVSITEQFHTERRRTPAQLVEVEEELDEYFQKHLPRAGFREFDLVGTGGTVTALKRLAQLPATIPVQRLHGQSLRLSRITALVSQLGGMNLAERRRRMSFEPERAAVIIAGALLLKSAMKHFLKGSLRISTRSLRWGYLLSKV